MINLHSYVFVRYFENLFTHNCVVVFNITQ